MEYKREGIGKCKPLIILVRRGIIPSLTLFRLKIAAIAVNYCVCGFYHFFVKCVILLALRKFYFPFERLIIPAIALGVVSSVSVLKPAFSCNASVNSVLV